MTVRKGNKESLCEKCCKCDSGTKKVNTLNAQIRTHCEGTPKKIKDELRKYSHAAHPRKKNIHIGSLVAMTKKTWRSISLQAIMLHAKMLGGLTLSRFN